MSKINDRWSALSMKDRAALIDIYVKSGITDLGEIRKDYNSFGPGGDLLKAGASFIPVVGTVIDGIDLIKDPSWENAAYFAGSLASDVLGLTAIKGLAKTSKALKAAKALAETEKAAATAKYAKLASKTEAIDKLNNAKKSARAAGQRGRAYYDDLVAKRKLQEAKVAAGKAEAQFKLASGVNLFYDTTSQGIQTLEPYVQHYNGGKLNKFETGGSTIEMTPLEVAALNKTLNNSKYMLAVENYHYNPVYLSNGVLEPAEVKIFESQEDYNRHYGKQSGKQVEASKKSFIRDFIYNFKGFDPNSLMLKFASMLSSNQKEEAISNEELAKELNIDSNLNTFVIPDELSERTFVSKVNGKIKEKTDNELIAEIKSKSKDEIIEIQGQLASEGYYDFQLKKGKSKQATEVQKRLVKEGLLDSTEVDGNIGEQTIRALQTLLVSKGYLPEFTDSGKTNIDGLLGKRTQEAFKLYNRDYNIDGNAGNKTINAYIKKESIKNEGFNTYVSAEGMQDKCAKWVTKKYDTVAGNSMQNGVIGNAWQMIKNIEDKGGEIIFNIYENPLFDNVTSPQQVKQAVNEYFSTHKIDYSTLQPGDVVGIHNPSSEHYSEVLESGTTYNTHVGIVVDVENGIPIVEHNILGNVRRERIDKLTGSKTGRPVVTAASRPVQGERLKGNLEFDNIMSDLKLPTNPNEQMKEYMNSLASSKRVFKEIYPEVDMDFIEKAAVAITKRETNFMEDKMSDVKKGSAGIKSAASAYLRDVIHNIKGTPEEAKSRDLTKMKFNSLSSNYREAIGLYSPEQLDNDPTITGRATMLLLSKNYDYFVRFAKENPELKLTEEDIRNATILSYNRGLGSVSSLGFDIKKDSITGEIQYVPDFNEIKYLRNKSKIGAKEKDFTSTSLRHLDKISGLAGALGELFYNKYGNEHVTYMASANEMIENLK